jgi:hypothetical protein
MTNDESREQVMWTDLESGLLEFPTLEQKLPRATDRDILRAMLGKPFTVSQDEPVKFRKAG